MKTKKLQRNKLLLSTDMSRRLNVREGGIVSAVTNAVDSGSEDGFDYKALNGSFSNQQSSMRLSGTWKSTMGEGSLKLIKRSYDETGDTQSRSNLSDDDGPLLKSAEGLNYDYDVGSAVSSYDISNTGYCHIN